MGKITMWFVGGISVVIGFMIIMPLIRMLSNKIYKLSLKKNGVDLDNYEPEIIRKDSTKKE